MKNFYLLSQFQWKFFASLALILILLCILIPSGLPKVQADSGWLSGWGNRVQITVDSANIDADLTHFPLLVHLSGSCGQDSQNLTAVFDEVGSSYQKIAVTSDDGQTQLYVEVEDWDATNAEAWLWVSKSGWTISSSTDTTLYLYYDGSHDDNSTYVGVTGSTPARAVWDSNFVANYHMPDNPDTSHIMDSTSNNFSGTKKGSNEPLGSSGQIGQAQDFDGTDDIITIPDNSSLTVSGATTFSAWCKNTAPGKAIISKDGTGSSREWVFRPWGNGVPELYLFSTYEYDYLSAEGTTNITDGEWHYVVAVWDGVNEEGHISFYVDGVSDNISTERKYNSGYYTAHDSAANVEMGRYYLDNSTCFDGLIDEISISNTARSAAWVKAFYYSSSDNLISFSEPVSWLSGWENQVKITIDSSKIDSDLSHFPLLVHLSDSCGKNGQDLTAVFDEVGSNYQKIAVTSDDGQTQLYVEVEDWDATNAEAWLWVSKSGWTISSSTDTTLYLYYDGSHDDNSTYVGVTGSTAGKAVWDSNFVANYHMVDPDTGYIMDSTSHSFHETSTHPFGAAGQIGQAQDFDGTNDIIVIPDNSSLTVTGATTFSAWCKTTAPGKAIISKDGAGSSREWIFRPWGNGALEIYLFSATPSNYLEAVGTDNVCDGEWHYLVGVWDGVNALGHISFYVDGVSDTISMEYKYYSGYTPHDSAANVEMGRYYLSNSTCFDGLIDEISISNTARSAAWIKAFYYSSSDDLISFS